MVQGEISVGEKNPFSRELYFLVLEFQRYRKTFLIKSLMLLEFFFSILEDCSIFDELPQVFP